MSPLKRVNSPWMLRARLSMEIFIAVLVSACNALSLARHILYDF
jgi:hypothetical protein